MDTLGDALPREMARVRDKVLPEYDKIPEGIFAATLRSSLGRLAMLDALRGAIIGGALLVGVGVLVLEWWLA